MPLKLSLMFFCFKDAIQTSELYKFYKHNIYCILILFPCKQDQLAKDQSLMRVSKSFLGVSCNWCIKVINQRNFFSTHYFLL